MWTREHGKRCDTSDFLYTPLAVKAVFATRGGRPNRVVVNFLLARLAFDLAGVPATATFTISGPVAGFGLFFPGSGGQQFPQHGRCWTALFEF